MAAKIALAGNPNSGKTTLFNALTGSNQYVGNWPGVTVEKKEGKLKGNTDVVIQDLPGIYSLSPYTLEEVVSRNYLVTEKPDAILNIVDGTNIERNLYLTTQLIELGIPVVVAVNMMDLVRKNGDVIDTEGLSKKLGCPVVWINPHGRGPPLVHAVLSSGARVLVVDPGENPWTRGPEGLGSRRERAAEYCCPGGPSRGWLLKQPTARWLLGPKPSCWTEMLKVPEFC